MFRGKLLTALYSLGDNMTKSEKDRITILILTIIIVFQALLYRYQTYRINESIDALCRTIDIYLDLIDIGERR